MRAAAGESLQRGGGWERGREGEGLPARVSRGGGGARRWGDGLAVGGVVPPRCHSRPLGWGRCVRLCVVGLCVSVCVRRSTPWTVWS